MLSLVSTDGCCAGAKLAVVAPVPHHSLAISPAAPDATAPSSPAVAAATPQYHSRQADAACASRGGAREGESPEVGEDAAGLERCGWFIPDLEGNIGKSDSIRTLLQALGAVATPSDRSLFRHVMPWG
jgi:hypothetical protein